jgi:hypothetical protein
MHHAAMGIRASRHIAHPTQSHELEVSRTDGVTRAALAYCAAALDVNVSPTDFVVPRAD